MSELQRTAVDSGVSSARSRSVTATASASGDSGGGDDKWLPASVSYLCYILWGCTGPAALVAYLAATPYIQFKLRDDNITLHHWTMHMTAAQRWGNHRRLNYMQALYPSVFTFTFAVFAILSTLLSSWLAAHTYSSTRIIWGHVLIVIATVPQLFFAVCDVSSWRMAFLCVTVALACVVANFGGFGLLLGTVVAVATCSKHKYAARCSVLDDLLGIVFAAMAIASRSALANPNHAGLLYFASAVLVVAASLISYIAVWRMGYRDARIEVQKRSGRRSEQAAPLEHIAALPGASIGVPRSQSQSASTRLSLTASATASRAVGERATGTVTGTAAADPPAPSLRRVLGEVWFDCAAFFLLSLVTFIVYPGVASLVATVHQSAGQWTELFSAVACFLVAPIGAASGKAAAVFLRWPDKERRRYRLITLLLLLARAPAAVLIYTSHIPARRLPATLIRSDVAFVALMLAHTATHGYLQSNIHCNATGGSTLDTGERGVASTLAVCGCMAGLLVASLLSTILVKAIV